MRHSAELTLFTAQLSSSAGKICWHRAVSGSKYTHIGYFAVLQVILDGSWLHREMPCLLRAQKKAVSFTCTELCS